jgi:hypothetical protein
MEELEVMMMMRKNMEVDENEEGDKYATGPYLEPDESS